MIDSPVLCWGSASQNPINPATRAFLSELFPRREEVTLEDGDHFSLTRTQRPSLPTIETR